MAVADPDTNDSTPSTKRTPRWNRVVLKVSGEAFAGEAGLRRCW